MTIEHVLPDEADPRPLTERLAGALLDGLRTMDGRPGLVLLSGGSALPVYDTLAPRLREAAPDGAGWLFGMVDERYDAEANTYLELKTNHQAFLAALDAVGAGFADTSPVEPDQYRMAERYHGVLSRQLEQVRQGQGKVIILLGMGPDGHTAGMMPYPENPEEFHRLFIDTDRLVVGYDASGRNPYARRFTATVPLLRQADRLYAYVTGAAKQEKLQEALNGTAEPAVLPAVLLGQLRDRLILATDCSISL